MASSAPYSSRPRADPSHDSQTGKVSFHNRVPASRAHPPPSMNDRPMFMPAGRVFFPIAPVAAPGAAKQLEQQQREQQQQQQQQQQREWEQQDYDPDMQQYRQGQQHYDGDGDGNGYYDADRSGGRPYGEAINDSTGYYSDGYGNGYGNGYNSYTNNGYGGGLSSSSGGTPCTPAYAALSAEQRAGAHARVLAYLSSPACLLFAEATAPIRIRASSAAALVATLPSPLHAVDLLRGMSDYGQRFQTWAELIDALVSSSNNNNNNGGGKGAGSGGSNDTGNVVLPMVYPSAAAARTAAHMSASGSLGPTGTSGAGGSGGGKGDSFAAHTSSLVSARLSAFLATNGGNGSARGGGAKQGGPYSASGTYTGILPAAPIPRGALPPPPLLPPPNSSHSAYTTTASARAGGFSAPAVSTTYGAGPGIGGLALPPAPPRPPCRTTPALPLSLTQAYANSNAPGSGAGGGGGGGGPTAAAAAAAAAARSAVLAHFAASPRLLAVLFAETDEGITASPGAIDSLIAEAGGTAADAIALVDIIASTRSSGSSSSSGSNGAAGAGGAGAAAGGSDKSRSGTVGSGGAKKGGGAAGAGAGGSSSGKLTSFGQLIPLVAQAREQESSRRRVKLLAYLRSAQCRLFTPGSHAAHGNSGTGRFSATGGLGNRAGATTATLYELDNVIALCSGGILRGPGGAAYFPYEVTSEQVTSITLTGDGPALAESADYGGGNANAGANSGNASANAEPTSAAAAAETDANGAATATATEGADGGSSASSGESGSSGTAKPAGAAPLHPTDWLLPGMQQQQQQQQQQQPHSRNNSHTALLQSSGSSTNINSSGSGCSCAHGHSTSTSTTNLNSPTAANASCNSCGSKGPLSSPASPAPGTYNLEALKFRLSFKSFTLSFQFYLPIPIL